MPERGTGVQHQGGVRLVDQQARDEYAERLRHFAAGVLTVEVYEAGTEAVAVSDDRALREIWFAAWCLYDDFRTERLRGKWALNREARREVARWLLFLYSDNEYRWPAPGILGCILNLATFGWWEYVRTRPAGEREYWPCQSRAELEFACQNSPFSRAGRACPPREPSSG
jgi:hypothetical protein